MPPVRLFQLLGVEPDVRVVFESFLALPHSVHGTDRMTLIQRRLAARMKRGEDFRLLECPFPAVPLNEAMWWHPMHDADPAHARLRTLFAHIGSQLDGQ